MSIDQNRSHISDLSPEYALLGFLYFEPLHGYELHRRLEANLREVWRIPQNQAYNILKRLEKEGFVQPFPQGESGSRGLTPLALTEAGRRRFETWLRAPTPCSARALRMEFLTRLFFAAQLDKDLPDRLVREQETALRAAVLRLEARLAAVPTCETYNRLSLELRLRQLQTIQTWLQTLKGNQ